MIQEKSDGAFRFPIKREELWVPFFERLSCPGPYPKQITVASDRIAG